MKKREKKLVLAKETVALLAGAETHVARGGTFTPLMSLGCVSDEYFPDDVLTRCGNC